jgi:hypothetical protein
MQARAALLMALAVAWGVSVDGIRVGISRDSSELHVFVQNDGQTARNVLIGYDQGKSTQPNLKFIATTPDGREHEGFDPASFQPLAGLVVPVVARIEPGAIRELRFPLRSLLCVEKPGDVTFDALVKQGASVRVALQVDAMAAQWSGARDAWIGAAVSPEVF